MPHRERHRTERVGWLRAAVLGANDGIVSTASLVVGVAAAHATSHDILVAGVAGLVAGAMSMAAGEYVSVSSQADTEQADLERERKELVTDEAAELAELAAIYVKRGLDPSLAKQVAEQLTAHDALAAHARDELGISDIAQCEARAGGAGLGGHIRGWRCHALTDSGHCSRGISHPHCRRNVTGFPRDPGRSGRVRWWCKRYAWRSAGHVLGGTRHGADRRRRGPVRNGCVRESVRRRHPRVCKTSPLAEQIQGVSVAEARGVGGSGLSAALSWPAAGF